jgi:hypothetical protein
MKNPIGGSVVLFPLVSAAGIEAALRKPTFVADDTGTPTANSVDLLRAFSKNFPELWLTFQTELGISTELIFGESEQFASIEETLPEPIVCVDDTDKASKMIADFQSKYNPPMTKPIKEAVRQAMREAKESQQSPSIGRVAQIMLTGDCNARQRLDDAIIAIPTTPSIAPDPGSMFNSIQAGIKEMIDKTWPTIREVGHSERHRAYEEKHYAENPGYYHGRINLPEYLKRPILREDLEFTQLSGGCLHAAKNEARMRKAPEATLDHMFFSLLQHGLETTNFLEEKGVDWRKWQLELDSLIPTYEGEGPRFPPNARNLGMNLLEDRIRPQNPTLSDYEGENIFEQWRDKVHENEKMVRPRKFSDLLWIIPCFKEPETLAYGYLTTAGITVEEVMAETDSVY